MLLKGLNHVAIISNDASRLNAFYRDVFDAEVVRDGSEFPQGKGPRLSIIKIGDWAELNVFEIEGNHEADTQTPMFGPRPSRPPGSPGRVAHCVRDHPGPSHGPRCSR